MTDSEERRDATSLLTDFGIAPDVEKVWRTLMARPRSTPDDLARSAGLHDRAFNAALTTLASAQLLREGDTPTGWVAIDPALSVDAHIVRAERRLTAGLDQLAALRGQLPFLAHEYARGRAEAGDEPGFEIVTNSEDVIRQVLIIGELTKHEHRNLTFKQNAIGLRKARVGDIALVRRGARARSIVGANDLSNADFYAELQISHEHGEQIRTLPALPTRLIIADRDVAILPVDPNNANLGAMFVRVRNLIDLLIYMFDRLWDEAVPLFHTGTPSAGSPTGRADSVLRLLAVGHTDPRIARTLGVGERTVRREVSDLKVSLGVSSRAEIVAAAFRRQWL